MNPDEIYESFKSRNIIPLIAASQSLLFGDRIHTHVCVFRGWHSGGGSITLLRGKPAALFDTEFTCPLVHLPESFPQMAGHLMMQIEQCRQSTPPQHRQDRIAVIVWIMYNFEALESRHQKEYVRVQLLGSGMGSQNPLSTPLMSLEPKLISIAVNERKVLNTHLAGGGAEAKLVFNPVTMNPEKCPAGSTASATAPAAASHSAFISLS